MWPFQYVKDPELQHKILGLDKREVNEAEYARLLEKNTADEARIRLQPPHQQFKTHSFLGANLFQKLLS